MRGRGKHPGIGGELHQVHGPHAAPIKEVHQSYNLMTFYTHISSHTCGREGLRWRREEYLVLRAPSRTNLRRHTAPCQECLRTCAPEIQLLKRLLLRLKSGSLQYWLAFLCDIGHSPAATIDAQHDANHDNISVTFATCAWNKIFEISGYSVDIPNIQETRDGARGRSTPGRTGGNEGRRGEGSTEGREGVQEYGKEEVTILHDEPTNRCANANNMIAS